MYNNSVKDITVKCEMDQEATFCTTDLVDKYGESEMQLDAKNFVIDELETKDFKIEIDETNYDEMFDNFHCATEPTINVKIKAENETIVESLMAGKEQQNVFLLSNKAQKEGNVEVPCLKVETEMDAVTTCSDDTHIKAANSNCRKISFNCNLCNREFAKNQLLAHLRFLYNVKGYKCYICPKAFSDKSTFLRHGKVHKGEKPYKCDFCGKAFLQISKYDQHKCIHMHENLYNCDLCGKSFSRKSNYSDHRRIHTGENTFKCDFCGKVFLQISTYDTHRRIHTGERPYKCDLCGKAYTSKSCYNRHNLIHTREKPYKCDLCGFSYSRKHEYDSHRRSHTGEKPYKCDSCGEAFSRKTDYNRHRRIHTGE